MWIYDNGVRQVLRTHNVDQAISRSAKECPADIRLVTARPRRVIETDPDAALLSKSKKDYSAGTTFSGEE